MEPNKHIVPLSAELFVTDASGKTVSLGSVTGFRIDDPEDLIAISTYQPVSPEEISRRAREEFGT